MRIPSGFERVQIEGSHEKELQFIYPDSSIVYFSNDLKSGSFSNRKNLALVETRGFDYLNKDTILNEGFSNKGYWKELKLKSVVIGYLNIPFEKKIVFDKSLKSIR